MTSDNEQPETLQHDSDVEIVPEEGGAKPDTESKLRRLSQDLRQCEKEKREYLDGWQRAKADFVNYKNDEAKRLEDTARFMVRSLVQDLLPVLDSFRLALEHGLSKETEHGVLLIRAQLEDVLKRRGLEKIAVTKGDLFSPEVHESIGEIESEVAPGTIAEVLQDGYSLHGLVVRPARVRLGVPQSSAGA